MFVRIAQEAEEAEGAEGAEITEGAEIAESEPGCGFRIHKSRLALRNYSMMPYEKFVAWEAAHELALEVYRITEQWPRTERYELTSQTRRAALSAPTNIAEGAAKRGTREFRRYLDIALGSLSELSYLLRFTKDRGIIDDATFRALEELRNQAGTLTWRLYARMSRTVPPLRRTSA
jgi:four helix bundle protein